MTNKERFLNGEHFYLPNSDVLYSFSDNAISGFCGGILEYSIVESINKVGFLLKDATVYCFAFIRFENEQPDATIVSIDANQLNLFSPQTN